MKTYGGAEVYSHSFLTSVLVGGECPASRLSSFIPEERATGSHWIGHCVGLINNFQEVNNCINIP
jgi:hypothetical protein